jgi:hypothetical protein
MVLLKHTRSKLNLCYALLLPKRILSLVWHECNDHNCKLSDSNDVIESLSENQIILVLVPGLNIPYTFETQIQLSHDYKPNIHGDSVE